MSDIPSEVRDLIRDRVTSMDHVEVLMRLHALPDEMLTVTQVQIASRLGPETTQRSLADLVRAGLVRHDAASDSYQFAPSSAVERRAVDALSIMYHQRPVTLVRLVYEQPPSPVKKFADAFRLKDEPREDQ